VRRQPTLCQDCRLQLAKTVAGVQSELKERIGSVDTAAQAAVKSEAETRQAKDKEVMDRINSCQETVKALTDEVATRASQTKAEELEKRCDALQSEADEHSQQLGEHSNELEHVRLVMLFSL